MQIGCQAETEAVKDTDSKEREDKGETEGWAEVREANDEARKVKERERWGGETQTKVNRTVK